MKYLLVFSVVPPRVSDRIETLQLKVEEHGLGVNTPL